jgi:hypothetical protein
MSEGRTPDVDSERTEAESLLASVLGEAPPAPPADAIWAKIRPDLPAAPRGRLLRHPAGLAALAAAAVILVLAVVALLSSGDEPQRLRLRVLDVPEEQQSRPLSREEAAEIFYGTEAPVLLGSDSAAGVPTGG